MTLAFLWILWCSVHSLLITEQIQNWVNRQDNWLSGSYRLLYVLFSLLSLIPILLYQYTLPQQVIFSWHGWWRIPQIILLVYAVVLFWLGSRNYDILYFLGIRQWRNHNKGVSTPKLVFCCQGIALYLRHPWYSGGLAVLWGWGPITDVSLISQVILTAYLVIGTLLEERKLYRQLGLPYQNYCQQVPMLFPWKGKAMRCPDAPDPEKNSEIHPD